MTASSEPLALRLRRLRDERGFSQRSLAAAAGISPATVAQLELGHRMPNMRTCLALCRALGVRIEDLVPEVIPMG